MYIVSDAYKKAIDQDAREFFYDAEVITNEGKKFTVSEQQILKGSASIVSQCCGNDEIELGSVYTSEFSLSLMIEMDRFALMDGEIRPYFNIKLDDGSVERIPLGIFDIAEAYRKINIIEITAYDHMARLEETYLMGQTSGTPYDFLALTAQTCGVALGNTQEEIEAMPNGTEILSLTQENDIETWRDFVHYIAQVLAGFATIDRNGSLVIRQYGASPQKRLTEMQRFSSNFADYLTRYTGVKHQNTKKGIVDYVHSEPDNGLTMDLEANPLLQQSSDIVRKKRLLSILDGLKNILYVPYETTAIEDPSIDLGDVLSFSGRNVEDGSISCITHINLKFNGRQTLKCVGKNPRLMKAKSKTDKQLANLQNSVTDNVLNVYTYTNTKKYSIGQNRTEVVSVQYVTTKSTNAEFKGVILVNVAAAGTVSVVYMSSDKEIKDFIPMQVMQPGMNIINLYYPLSELTENTVGSFRVYLMMDSGNGTIERGGVKATIVGQGFAAAENVWDGRLEFKDEFQRVEFSDREFSVKPLTDNVTVDFLPQKKPVLTDRFERIVFDTQSFTVRPLTENLAGEVVIKSFTMDASRPGDYDDRFIMVDGDGRFVLNQAYTFHSTEKPIDQGRMCEVVINTDPFETVTGIEVV